MRLDELLCALGLHHPLWQGEQTVSRYALEAWLQVRRCARCGKVLAR